MCIFAHCYGCDMKLATDLKVSVNIKEKDFQQQVVDLARYTGWRVAHFRSVRVQRKDGSVFFQTPVQADGAGFPDCVLVKGTRIIYAELKTEKGKVSPQQQEWLDALSRTGNEVYLWKPSDYEEICDVLGK